MNISNVQMYVDLPLLIEKGKYRNLRVSIDGDFLIAKLEHQFPSGSIIITYLPLYKLNLNTAFMESLLINCYKERNAILIKTGSPVRNTRQLAPFSLLTLLDKSFYIDSFTSLDKEIRNLSEKQEFHLLPSPYLTNEIFNLTPHLNFLKR